MSKPEEGDMPENTKNVHQRMHAVMELLDYVCKESKKVNNQYSFVSHDAVTAAVRAQMVDQGLVCLVTVIEHSQDGNRTDATIRAKIVNIDDPSDFVEVDSFGFGVDTQDKGPGKAISYALKYALLKTFMLETGDDPERDQIDHESQEDQRAGVMQNVARLMKEHSVTRDELIAVTGKPSRDMTDEELQTVPAIIISQFPLDRLKEKGSVTIIGSCPSCGETTIDKDLVKIDGVLYCKSCGPPSEEATT